MDEAPPYRVRPATLAQAAAFVREHHRHHAPPQGWKWGARLVNSREQTIGVIMAGRPVARGLDDGLTLEVTRCCVLEGHKNANSMLYGAIRRAAKALGYARLVTYTLASEPGDSLRASGFTLTGTVAGRSWTTPSRPRTDKHPTVDKLRWEVEL